MIGLSWATSEDGRLGIEYEGLTVTSQIPHDWAVGVGVEGGISCTLDSQVIHSISLSLLYVIISFINKTHKLVLFKMGNDTVMYHYLMVLLFKRYSTVQDCAILR